jgi:hypothetical protein
MQRSHGAATRVRLSLKASAAAIPNKVRFLVRFGGVWFVGLRNRRLPYGGRAYPYHCGLTKRIVEVSLFRLCTQNAGQNLKNFGALISHFSAERSFSSATLFLDTDFPWPTARNHIRIPCAPSCSAIGFGGAAVSVPTLPTDPAPRSRAGSPRARGRVASPPRSNPCPRG